jgi:sortase (surface protein transpeptidase)
VGVVRVCVAAALALAAVGLLGAGLAGRPAPQPAVVAPAPESDPPAPPDASTSARPASPSPSPSPTTDVRDRIDELVLPESEPVSVAIPDLDVRSRLIDLGLDGQGEMEVPEDPAQAGWYSRGATPGALGPSIIAGHVTWDGAPAIFHRLGELRRGDRVTVTRADEKTAVFTVTRVTQFAKSRFPTKAVYGPIDHAGLRLVTCGGTYDAARHRYLDNVIVFARLSDVQEPGD